MIKNLSKIIPFNRFFNFLNKNDSKKFMKKISNDKNEEN